MLKKKRFFFYFFLMLTLDFETAKASSYCKGLIIGLRYRYRWMMLYMPTIRSVRVGDSINVVT